MKDLLISAKYIAKEENTTFRLEFFRGTWSAEFVRFGSTSGYDSPKKAVRSAIKSYTNEKQK